MKRPNKVMISVLLSDFEKLKELCKTNNIEVFLGVVLEPDIYTQAEQKLEVMTDDRKEEERRKAIKMLTEGSGVPIE